MIGKSLSIDSIELFKSKSDYKIKPTYLGMHDYGNRFSEAVYSYVLKDGQCFGVTGYRGDACVVLCMAWKPVSWPQNYNSYP